jgi:tripartite-type tricarboxylate transporter receptor subunit TctC
LKKKILRVAALCLAAAAPFMALAAPTYPDHVIRMISPYAPGGGTDVLARIVVPKLPALLGQNVIVVNKPGAGGVLGTAEVAKSAPDGYTLLMASPSPIVVAPHINRNVSYDALKDLVPVALVAATPAIVTVNNKFPAQDFAGFMAYVKANPGKVAFGSSGIGGTGHLAGELFMAKTGTRMIHVPFKSGGEAMAALLSDQVQVIFGEPIALLPHIQAGQLRGLAVTTLQPSPILPGMPTVAQTIPGFTAGPWFGIFAPKGTPPAIVDKLNAEVNKVLAMPDVQQAITRLGAEPGHDTPAQFGKLVREENARWGGLVEQIGLKAE